MRLRWIIPFLGYREMTQEQARQLDLEDEYVWQCFEIEWLGVGITLWVRPKGIRL